MARVEEGIIAKHFGLPYRVFKSIAFEEYAQVYLKAKEYKRTHKLDGQRRALNKEELKAVLTSAIESIYEPKSCRRT